MKATSNGLIAFAAVAFGGLVAIPAQGALTINLSDGVGIAVSCSNGTDAVVCTTNDGAYTVVLTTAIDNSPAGPAFITKTGNITSTAGAIGHPLTIAASDTNFVLPAGPGMLAETVNTNTPILVPAIGSLVGTGYLSNTNTLFDTSGTTTGAATVNTFALGAATAGTSANFATPFALDEVLVVTVTSPGPATFTSTLSATQVPEPAAVILLGSVLLFVAGAVRRRRVTRA